VRFGVLASVCLYLPIVVYRAITVALFWPVPSLTLAVGMLEFGLLTVAAVLLVRAVA
jgi:hypothetical protein